MSPDQADIILRANYRNPVKKVSAGRTLSAGEVNLLQAMEDGGRPASKVFARNHPDLAAQSGISRKTLPWSTRF